MEGLVGSSSKSMEGGSFKVFLISSSLGHIHVAWQSAPHFVRSFGGLLCHAGRNPTWAPAQRSPYPWRCRSPGRQWRHTPSDPVRSAIALLNDMSWNRSEHWSENHWYYDYDILLSSDPDSDSDSASSSSPSSAFHRCCAFLLKICYLLQYLTSKTYLH